MASKPKTHATRERFSYNIVEMTEKNLKSSGNDSLEEESLSYRCFIDSPKVIVAQLEEETINFNNELKRNFLFKKPLRLR